MQRHTYIHMQVISRFCRACVLPIIEPQVLFRGAREERRVGGAGSWLQRRLAQLRRHNSMEMQVCAFAYVYVCMSVCLCVCVCVCVCKMSQERGVGGAGSWLQRRLAQLRRHNSMDMQACVFEYVCVCMCECMYVCVRIMYVCMCISTHTFMNVIFSHIQRTYTHQIRNKHTHTGS